MAKPRCLLSLFVPIPKLDRFEHSIFGLARLAALKQNSGLVNQSSELLCLSSVCRQAANDLDRIQEGLLEVLFANLLQHASQPGAHDICRIH